MNQSPPSLTMPSISGFGVEHGGAACGDPGVQGRGYAADSNVVPLDLGRGSVGGRGLRSREDHIPGADGDQHRVGLGLRQPRPSAEAPHQDPGQADLSPREWPLARKTPTDEAVPLGAGADLGRVAIERRIAARLFGESTAPVTCRRAPHRHLDHPWPARGRRSRTGMQAADGGYRGPGEDWQTRG